MSSEILCGILSFLDDNHVQCAVFCFFVYVCFIHLFYSFIVAIESSTSADDEEDDTLLIGALVGSCSVVLVGVGILFYKKHQALNDEEERLTSESEFDSDSLGTSKGRSGYSIFQSSHAADIVSYSPTANDEL